ncbi:Uma2 family endonuclease [Dolichospermum circinale]|uniref:Uma2 family endonuclease n=1 Tax=Dolichospermum circinale TaxID=109265 RepID=UPI00232AEF2A|nr:Uma2 family endonuclease [Dolichospermum circinale]MDB9452513.1 Uma2 family endonuclease [Dolichospermum circinale CS-547]
MFASSQIYITPEEYLELEENSPIKYEYIDGYIIETLQEYILINPKKPRVECFRRNEDGLWVLQSYAGEETSFQLQSINFAGTMTQLYEDVDFPSPA